MVDSRQFVLGAAAFLIIAMVMVAIWNTNFAPPAPAVETRTTCSYTRFCDGGNCATPLPAPFALLDAGGNVRLEMAGRPEALERLAGVNGETDFLNRAPGSVLRISLAPSGAMSTRLTRDDASAAIITSGTGQCQAKGTGA